MTRRRRSTSQPRCEIVSVGEKPRKELMEQNGAYWYVNEGRDGVFDGDFNLLRSRGQEADAQWRASTTVALSAFSRHGHKV